MPTLYLGLVAFAIIMAVALAIILFHKIEKPVLEKTMKSDISLEQMNFQEIKLSSFIKQNNLPDSPSLESISHVLKITSSVTDASLQGNQATISESDLAGVYTATFNPNLNEKEKLFAFAHECAHLINGDSTPANRPDAANKSMNEQLVDYTAAAILMPLKEISSALSKARYKKLCRLRRYLFIQKLCKKYNVSDIVAIRRVNEVMQLSDMMNSYK